MMSLVLLSITLAVLLVDSSMAELTCHRWTEEDNNVMGPSRTPEDERQYCEGVLGYIFTQGKNEEYPGCGECWCCKPLDLVCHHWTEEDNNAMGPSRTPEEESQYCEDVLGYTFTQGKNEEYPGCGECWCCKPKDLVCHTWTEEDNKAMGPSRTPDDERKYCEGVLGYTFTQGDNYYYPKCEECWCCKPESTPF
ncbi:uncharacterized protein LOC132756058 [Ruditapes philippinarum]|uniref:uncharacterized protein LOC132756058 n=1 Tax=Ruditapes philippinarum TaxID=129788 RepID=UPI00295A8F7A|nr:uncharacterized protein LOC132756058 [Ruditapes philippinarum]